MTANKEYSTQMNGGYFRICAFVKCINSTAWTTAGMLRVTKVDNHKDEQFSAWGIRFGQCPYHTYSGSKK